ncbi:MAG: hypothetical protein IJT70_00670 [Clostridia bacterium]|nr:hypothetical protein [Clostridia bacterium]
MEHDAAVVQLILFGKYEAERIGAGQNDLHSAGDVDIRIQRRAFNEAVLSMGYNKIVCIFLP